MNAEAHHGLSSDSHKSQNTKWVLDHLMHLTMNFEPAKTYSPCPSMHRGQGVLAPPHSSITRGQVAPGHDLVAISMGPGGWVFKTKFKMLSMKCLSQNGIDYAYV